jgi:probable rRNA maturation factor
MTPRFDIDISDRQTRLAVDPDRVRAAVEHVLSEEGIASAEISVALVDDAEIHGINRDFLGHDYPTDVISFLMSQEEAGDGKHQTEDRSTEESRIARAFNDQPSAFHRQPSTLNPHPPTRRRLEGELVVSTETAVREAAVHGWTPADELLLYVVHGLLHLCGYDDLSDAARPIMRDRERQLLSIWNLIPTGLEV